MDRFDIIQRGHDSSGRPLKATRQAWQHYDRVNEAVGGKLVVVQGAFLPGNPSSAGTHDQAGCMDIRTWNLTDTERRTAIRRARELMAAAWYRTPAQGFDEHIHWVLIGDQPMHSAAAAQVEMYRQGFNGLGSFSHPDDFAFRPQTIEPYRYLEDDMFDEKDRKTLNQISQALATFRAHEVRRDKDEAVRDRERLSRLFADLGGVADHLGQLSDEISETATKEQLKKTKEQLKKTKERIVQALHSTAVEADERTPVPTG